MPQRFDDIFTQTHAGDGVNVFEFDSRTAPSHPDKMTWAQSVDIINDVLYKEMKAQSLAGFEAKREQIAEAWSTILRGV